MKKKLYFTVIATILMGAAFCSCSKEDPKKNNNEGGGNGNLPGSGVLTEGSYSIKYRVSEYEKNSYTVFTSKPTASGYKNLRLDYLYDSEYYDYSTSEDGIAVSYTSHSIYINGRDASGKDFGYEYTNSDNNGVWEDSDWARNTIQNDLAEYMLDPKYYVEKGFAKSGTITVLGKTLDLYVGTKSMLENFRWAGFDHLGEYEYKTMSFAFDGGILMYMAKDGKVNIEAVAVTTNVPDKAFSKQVDISWLK